MKDLKVLSVFRVFWQCMPVFRFGPNHLKLFFLKETVLIFETTWEDFWISQPFCLHLKHIFANFDILFICRRASASALSQHGNVIFDYNLYRPIKQSSVLQACKIWLSLA